MLKFETKKAYLRQRVWNIVHLHASFLQRASAFAWPVMLWVAESLTPLLGRKLKQAAAANEETVVGVMALLADTQQSNQILHDSFFSSNYLF